MGFNNQLGMDDQMSDPGSAFSGTTIKNTFQGGTPQFPNQAVTPQSSDMFSSPRSMQVNPYIKDSGAPVNFNPKSAQAINGMFGTPMENSYDRTMTPYDGSNFTGDQSMY